MKRGVEDGYLGQTTAEHFASGENTFDVRRIMQRGEIDAVFDSFEYFIGYQDGMGKSFASMDHSMADRVNVSDAANGWNSIFGARPTNNGFHPRARVAEGCGGAPEILAFDTGGHNGLAADAFQTATAQSLIPILFDQIEIGSD